LVTFVAFLFSTAHASARRLEAYTGRSSQVRSVPAGKQPQIQYRFSRWGGQSPLEETKYPASRREINYRGAKKKKKTDYTPLATSPHLNESRFLVIPAARGSQIYQHVPAVLLTKEIFLVGPKDQQAKGKRKRNVMSTHGVLSYIIFFHSPFSIPRWQRITMFSQFHAASVFILASGELAGSTLHTTPSFFCRSSFCSSWDPIPMVFFFFFFWYIFSPPFPCPAFVQAVNVYLIYAV
jgi:hypothetical protein